MIGSRGVIPAALRAVADEAAATVARDELVRLTARMVDTPSPTGEEETLARLVVTMLSQAGVEADYQPMDTGQGNAIARLRGAGGGANLMLHGPLDTVFGGPDEEDAPFLGTPPRADQRPAAEIADGWIVGAGAHNPKGHAVAAIMAVVALQRIGAPLRGDLVLALGAGGMPTNRRPGVAARRNGHGAGLAFLLEQGIRPDAAIVLKPGVPSWEEVGLAWFRVRVNGLLGYAGTRAVVQHRNPIHEAMRFVAAFERWLPEYSRRNASGLVAPTGSIGAIRGGWPYKPAFIPETCELFVDMRVSPRTDPAEVQAQFADAMTAIARAEKLALDWEMVLAIPGTTTPPGHWVLGSAIRAYETMTGQAYAPPAPGAGATEANILRLWGVPTVRMGLPPPPVPGRYSGRFSTGEVHVESIAALLRGYLYAAVDVCMRPRAEVMG